MNKNVRILERLAQDSLSDHSEVLNRGISALYLTLMTSCDLVALVTFLER